MEIKYNYNGMSVRIGSVKAFESISAIKYKTLISKCCATSLVVRHIGIEPV